jgi:hypothetical protein
MLFKTSDLNLAAFICASGISLTSHESNGIKTYFCFEQTTKIKDLEESYYNMSAVINPMHYGSALKVLKNIIYQKNSNYIYDNQQFNHQPRKAN